MPDISFNGKFIITPQNSGFRAISENGLYNVKYEIAEVSDENRKLTHVQLYKNEQRLYSLPSVPGADVYVSNSGCMAVLDMNLHFMQKLTIHFFDNKGESLFSEAFEYASLFGFSPSGKRFVVGTDKNLHVILIEENKIIKLKPASEFAFSEDETYLATARESDLTIYKNGKEINSINTGLFYPRGLAVDAGNNKVWIIGKQKIKAYQIENGSLFYEDELSEDFSFRDLIIKNDMIYSGIHYKYNGISKGIIRTYNSSGQIITEEVKATKSFQQFEKKPASSKSSKYNAIPWPFVPFDEVHKVWNHYEQHMGDGSGDWAYLHQGLDLEVPINEPTYAVEEGWVKLVLTIGGASYWRLAISPEQTSGYSDGWLYAHLVESSIMVDVGDYVEVHDYLGDIIYWSDDWGHIHFVNIHDQGNIWYYDDDEWGINFNPLLALDPITDEVAPVIENFSSSSKFGICINESSTFLNPGNVYGDIDIIAKISDFHGDSEWEQPAFKTYYWLTKLPANDTVFPKTLGQILNHSYEMYNSTFFTYYAPVLYYKDYLHPSPPWMNTSRDYYQILTNNNGDSIIEISESALAFETTNYTDGDYRLFVEAWDEFGNMDVDSMTVTFNNGIYTNTQSIVVSKKAGLYPNPCHDVVVIEASFVGDQKISLSIYNLEMQEFFNKEINPDSFKNGNYTINTNFLKSGIYLIELSNDENFYSNKLVKL
ncbi:MAG: T9SS type A sorting domain-containing protein [Bacteroidales bacterium]